MIFAPTDHEVPTELKYLHRLVVLHHLGRAHILMADAVGCYAVFATEQVGTLDIELVDDPALILDFA